MTRVNGFPGASAADATLRAWWRARYPAGGALTTPLPAAPAGAGAAPAAPANGPLIAEMNRLIANGSAMRAWFQRNYGVVVMDEAATRRRLRTVYSVPPGLIADAVDPDPADLASLEIALQMIPAAELRTLRGVRIGRKRTGLTRRNGAWEAGIANQFGVTLTLTRGGRTERTILYFNGIRDHDALMFRGSTAENAVAPSTMDILHELGHAVEHQGGVEAAFDAWLRAHPQAAPTEYAASNLTAELFPEFYALFHSDPHFLCGSAPLMYAWFAELARTGRAPRPTATLVPPPACPP